MHTIPALPNRPQLVEIAICFKLEVNLVDLLGVLGAVSMAPPMKRLCHAAKRYGLLHFMRAKLILDSQHERVKVKSQSNSPYARIFGCRYDEVDCEFGFDSHEWNCSHMKGVSWESGCASIKHLCVCARREWRS